MCLEQDIKQPGPSFLTHIWECCTQSWLLHFQCNCLLVFLPDSGSWPSAWALATPVGGMVRLSVAGFNLALARQQLFEKWTKWGKTSLSASLLILSLCLSNKYLKIELLNYLKIRERERSRSYFHRFTPQIAHNKAGSGEAHEPLSHGHLYRPSCAALPCA